MRHLKFGVPLLASLLGAIGITACSDENPWSKKSDQTGRISISLETSSDLKTAKPVFRSDEDGEEGDLSTYINIPSPDDFSIKLEKADGSFSKTWSTLADFKEYNLENLYETGSYTMTAYYGEKGKQDFNAPYFEASSSFTVLADQVHNVDLTAELMNSMVKINYSDEFRNYMKDYHTAIRTEGRADEIICVASESRAAFIEPNNAAMTVHFTTKNKEFTGSVALGEFAPLAKTLHNITFDIAENSNGDAQLQVSFDETLDEEPVYIDLTEELLTTPAPVITTEGFTSGETLDMLAGTESEFTIKMNVSAKGTVDKAIMTVESVYFSPTWGSQIDLCNASDENRQAMETAGISAIGFDRKSELAFLDLTSYCKSLPKGIHTITLKVTDKNGAVSETAKVTLNSEDIVIDEIEALPIPYASGQATILLNYNGANPGSEIKFYTPNASGNTEETRIISWEELNATRAFDKKRYSYTIEIPNTQIHEVEVEIYHNGKSYGKTSINVIFPAYEITAYDAFSKYAYVQVDAAPEDLATVIENLALQSNGSDLNIIHRDTQNGILTIKGLTPGTNYEVKSSLDKAHVTQNRKWNDNVTSFKTEPADDILNGDFSSVNKKLNWEALQVGGQWICGSITYTTYSSISRDLPAGWAHVNDLTVWELSSEKNKNTWYMVPSSWTENGIAVMRNVGYSHAGAEIETTGKFFSTTHYCTNVPNNLDKAAGEFFLGEYDYKKPVPRTDGITFSSRPTKISFEYTYELSHNQQDEGIALIKLLAEDNTILGSKEINLTPRTDWKTETIDFDYSSFSGKKASKLIVNFKSSNKSDSADIPIYVPSGNELDEGVGLPGLPPYHATVNPNEYKAVATGSVLKIDNVIAHYDDEPSSAPSAKPSTKKRK